MAVFDVIVYQITSTYPDLYDSVSYQDDLYIHAQYNDSTGVLSVQLTDTALSGGSDFGSPSTGPNLYSGGGTFTQITTPPFYQFCDGADLKKIEFIPYWPYARFQTSYNAVECDIGGGGCDLEMSSTVTVTNASSTSSSDGSVTVSATSSNGTIKYSFNQFFDYLTEGQTSGTFSGLAPGVYTVYAKDAIGCTDYVSVIIGVTQVYGVKWRIDYQDYVNRDNSRVDVLERDYAGAVVEVTAGPSPFRMMTGEYNVDKYLVINTTRAEIQFASTTSGQFEELFTQDDRKYQVKFYKNWGSGYELKFIGYVIPEFYSEPELDPPFITTFMASDQLGELKNTDLLDVNGNEYRGTMSQMEIITNLLKHTDLLLDIRCAINLFENDMDQAADDDPLKQAYVKADIFYKEESKNSDYILENNLKSYGARIFQSQGVWWITRTEDSVATFAYRVFNYEGAYQSNTTFNPVKDLKHGHGKTSRFSWRDRGQKKYLTRNYGRFEIAHNLVKDGNLIDEGRFEDEDRILTAAGSTFFRNWNFSQAQGFQTGEFFEPVQNGDSLGAFSATFQAGNTIAQADSELKTTSGAIPFTVNQLDKFKFKFQYKVTPNYNFPWVRIAWKLLVTSGGGTQYYLVLKNPLTGGANDDFSHWSLVDDENEEEQKQDIYVTNFDSWQTFETPYITTPSGVIQDEDATIQIVFYFHNHYGRDFEGSRITYADWADFKAYETTNVIPGKRLMFHDTEDSGEEQTLIYELQRTRDAETANGLGVWTTIPPEVVEPDDYDASTNPKKWKLQGVYAIEGDTSLVKKVMFDNVHLSYYPFIQPLAKNIEPTETVTYSQTEDENVVSTFKAEVLLGDAPNEDGAGNDMPILKNVYNSWLRFSDGTPTALWGRTSVPGESKTLLDILLLDYIGQMSSTGRKLTGSGVSDIAIDFVHCLKDENDDRKYIFTYYEYDDINCHYTVEIQEVFTGAAGVPPPQLGAFDPEQFDNDQFDV